VVVSSKDNELPFKVNTVSPYDIKDVFDYYSNSFYWVKQKDYKDYTRVMDNDKVDKEKKAEAYQNKKAAQTLDSSSDFHLLLDYSSKLLLILFALGSFYPKVFPFLGLMKFLVVLSSNMRSSNFFMILLP
jgi:thiol:disulfide interchange protein